MTMVLKLKIYMILWYLNLRVMRHLRIYSLILNKLYSFFTKFIQKFNMTPATLLGATHLLAGFSDVQGVPR